MSPIAGPLSLRSAVSIHGSEPEHSTAGMKRDCWQGSRPRDGPVRTILSQSSTIITAEKPQKTSGASCDGMTVVVERTMRSACLIEQCGMSISGIGLLPGGTIHGERRPSKLWRAWSPSLESVSPAAHLASNARYFGHFAGDWYRAPQKSDY